MAPLQRQSILCPSCQKLVSVTEPRCPHCGTAHPGSWWKHTFVTRSLNHPDYLIGAIIVFNVVMYILSLVLYPHALALGGNPLRAFSPSDRSLLVLGATGTIPIDHLQRWWTLVSANYLHGGVLHIVFNMLALRNIGTLIIREYGAYRMITLYTVSGILGFWVSYLAGIRFTIGASAAVCGLLGAGLYYGKSRGGLYGRALYRQLGGWALFLFFFGLLVPGINNWGHGGGMAAGGLLGFLLNYQERAREQQLHVLLAVGCIVLTVVVLGWAIIAGIYGRVTA